MDHHKNKSSSEPMSAWKWPEVDSYLSDRVKALNSHSLSMLRSHVSVSSTVSDYSHGSLSALPEGALECLSRVDFPEINPEHKTGPKYYYEAFDLMAPFISLVYRTIRDNCNGCRDEEACWTQYSRKLEWTGDAAFLVQCLKMCLERNCTEITLLALQLASVRMERSLGDILISVKYRCPPLLKDILAHPALAAAIGTDIIEILTVLIGPPTSLNLRNLAWHGFLSPNEVALEFPVFLTWLLIVIGERLDKKHLTVRRRNTKVCPLLLPKNLSLPFLDGGGNAALYTNAEQLFRASVLIPENRRMLFELITILFRKNQTWLAVNLLLPQIEAVLRLLFSLSNEEPKRILTAEILGRDAQLTENKLRNFLGDELLSFLLDLYIYPQGPRYRHTLSHGEYDQASITEIDGNALLAVTTCIILQAESDPLTPTSVTLNQWINSYTVRFHPVGIMKLYITSFVGELEKLNLCSLLKDYRQNSSVDGIFRSAFAMSAPFDQSCAIFRVIAGIIDYADWHHVFTAMAGFPFQTVFRPVSEAAFIKLCTLIWTRMVGVVSNIRNYMESTSQKFACNGELPKQNVLPYLRFLDVFEPLLEKIFSTGLLLFAVVTILQDGSRTADNAPQSRSKLSKDCKSLKKVLQAWENIDSLSKTSVNDYFPIAHWLNSLDSHLKCCFKFNF
ncbi:uncharacterized protein LOC129583759 isoform X3 [Paramacrobiotus metropolitanus]|uniref:uncharacterized protein LOC129583759 isoform X3 n=1 Tax=Paramacrobiotus metropolitanus TaxID=2943436 RepID=UPI002445F3DF|nr:uncharacterized protein LOC129583759 isoform X3 [Paramacrobiotus metropolitanus]